MKRLDTIEEYTSKQALVDAGYCTGWHDQMEKGAYIVCAAMQNSRGNVICSPRHFDSICQETIERGEGWDDWKDDVIQGFVDQWGYFYTRAEALIVAQARGQIRRRCGGDHLRLYSENLY